mmetsp:Transcript_35972/g.58166  ORF Transcript_35972/g.58166 Transcript_35972/m.58166 type:complete len:84 (-) Transcript_35972:1103-1354(-)
MCRRSIVGIRYVWKEPAFERANSLNTFEGLESKSDVQWLEESFAVQPQLAKRILALPSRARTSKAVKSHRITTQCQQLTKQWN